MAFVLPASSGTLAWSDIAAGVVTPALPVLSCCSGLVGVVCVVDEQREFALRLADVVRVVGVDAEIVDEYPQWMRVFSQTCQSLDLAVGAREGVAGRQPFRRAEFVAIDEPERVLPGRLQRLCFTRLVREFQNLQRERDPPEYLSHAAERDCVAEFFASQNGIADLQIFDVPRRVMDHAIVVDFARHGDLSSRHEAFDHLHQFGNRDLFDQVDDERRHEGSRVGNLGFVRYSVEFRFDGGQFQQNLGNFFTGKEGSGDQRQTRLASRASAHTGESWLNR